MKYNTDLHYTNLVEFEELKGKTFHTVKQDMYDSNDALFFIGDDYAYILTHTQNCCEYVYIESIEGDIENLLPNQEILTSEERTQKASTSEWGDSETWSFYTIRTMRDTFTIRFYGSSNGYYGEEAELYEIDKDNIEE